MYFYSGGLKLGVYQLTAIDSYPEVKHIDNPFKIIKNPNSNSIPTKGEIKRKLNYAEKTGTKPNLTDKEWAYKKKYKIPSKHDLSQIDNMEINSKKRKDLKEKLKAKQRNTFLESKKKYEDIKTEKIAKKIEKLEAKNIKFLEKNVQELIESNKNPEAKEIWEKMTSPLIGKLLMKRISKEKREKTP
jgi:hypothetical protein